MWGKRIGWLGGLGLGAWAAFTVDPAAAQSSRPAIQLPSFVGAGAMSLSPRTAAEAEAPKTEAERRAAMEEDVKRKAEEVRRLSVLEAEARRKAEQEQRLLQEENAARKRAEERQARLGKDQPVSSPPAPVAAPVAAPAPLPQAVPPAQNVSPAPPPRAPKAAAAGMIAIPKPAKPCGPPAVSTAPVIGGRMRIDIAAPCRAGQPFRITYGEFAFRRQLDSEGNASFVLDLFASRTVPLELNLDDGTRTPLAVRSGDLDKVSKIAVVWQAPVDLDLHAFEYSAELSEPGHVWSGRPSSAEASLQLAASSKRGHGFLSSTDIGASEGSKIEVYTFWHHAEQPSVTVGMALDFASRGEQATGEFCGSGRLANIPFTAIVLERSGAVRRESGMIAPARCGEKMTDLVRYRNAAVPELRVRQ